MTPRVGRLMLPTHPHRKAAVLEENLQRGWAPVPGISDHEMGTILRADNPTAPIYAPRLPHPPARDIPAPVRVGAWTIAAIFGFVILVAALTALVLP